MSDTVAVIVSILAVVVAGAWGPIWSAIRGALASAPTHTPPGVPLVVPLPTVSPGPTKVTFPAAIDALAIVRNRLVETGCMSDPATAAVEAITHALVAGTDK